MTTIQINPNDLSNKRVLSVVSAHFRSGLSRGSNFRFEINGMQGDLIATSSLGYLGIGETKVQGAQGEEAAVRNLDVPQKYVTANADIGIIATTLSNNYALSLPTSKVEQKRHRHLQML
jgi:hypothetical protein